PTITASAPRFAPGAPPLTGASTNSTPCSAHRAASSTAVESLIVECTATVVPGAAVSSSSPTTCRTCASSTTTTEITAHLAASSAAEDADSAPASVNGVTASARISQTVSPPGQS